MRRHESGSEDTDEPCLIPAEPQPGVELDPRPSCDHQWQFGGMVYSHGDLFPGSTARKRIYERWFYCVKCTESKYSEPTEVGHEAEPVQGNAMLKLLFGPVLNTSSRK